MRRGPKINIWCAASSTGQEPYTIAMLIMDAVKDTKVPGVLPEDFAVIASDVSNEVLSKAMSGTYNKMEISRGLPDYYKNQYFSNQNDKWMVKEQIQKLVEFRRVNLVESFTYLGGFDIIFCRNVLIYFDSKTRLTILEQFHKMLNSDGFLILGASENIIGVSDKFESNHIGRTIIYKHKPNKEVSV
jgi:chemotaxis protein methyltransferase CheR